MLLTQDYHRTTTAHVLEKRVDQFTAIMRSWMAARPNQPISHLVYRGVSGACMAWPLSYRLRIPVVAVRKPGEDSHTYNDGNGAVSGDGDLLRYVIVDDFICTGHTIKKIIERIDLKWKDYAEMGHDLEHKPICEGVLLHAASQYGACPEFFNYDDRQIPIISENTACGEPPIVNEPRLTDEQRALYNTAQDYIINDMLAPRVTSADLVGNLFADKT